MRERQQVVEYIKKQLSSLDYEPSDSKYGWHYGRIELRDLLDFIYEEKPKEDERLMGHQNGNS